MISELASLIYTTLDSCFSWVRDIYRSFGISFVGIFFAMVLLSALARFILRPFIGVGASDTATAKELKFKSDVESQTYRKRVKDYSYLKSHGYID